MSITKPGDNSALAYISGLNRKDPGKCTRLHDETQGTMKHKRFRQMTVFVRYKKIETLFLVFRRIGNNEIQALSTDNCLRQVYEDRFIVPCASSYREE